MAVKHILYGNWLVRGIKSPTGFVLTETAYPVDISKDGTVIEVEVENIRIRGTGHLTKVDENYPDNKLSGVEYGGYFMKECTAPKCLVWTRTPTILKPANMVRQSLWK